MCLLDVHIIRFEREIGKRGRGDASLDKYGIFLYIDLSFLDEFFTRKRAFVT